MISLRRRLLAVSVLLLASACGGPRDDSGVAPETWWKGNLHTHSLWSDGDDYPEAVVAWYHDRDYHFVAVSDHNVLARGERWIDVATSAGGIDAHGAYLARFGDAWVETRTGASGETQVRLKRFEEYRTRFEEPGRFLLMESEEISDRFEAKPIHVNATNVREPIPPQGGTSVADVLQNNVDAVLAQRAATGQPMFPHVNHPNFGWAVTAEDLIPLEGEKFFEVYNGHPAVHNDGDELHPGTERLWDIILSERLRTGREILYGIAVDDAHHYQDSDASLANPGRGWVMVRATALTARALISAMEAGDFYASSGVVLDDVRIGDDRMEIVIRPDSDVTYRTEFVGTLAGYDTSSVAVPDGMGGHVTRRYSPAIGAVLAVAEGPSPSYRFSGDELYVRARVISSKEKRNVSRPGETERAWVQPVVLRR